MSAIGVGTIRGRNNIVNNETGIQPKKRLKEGRPESPEISLPPQLIINSGPGSPINTSSISRIKKISPNGATKFDKTKSEIYNQIKIYDTGNPIISYIEENLDNLKKSANSIKEGSTSHVYIITVNGTKYILKRVFTDDIQNVESVKKELFAMSELNKIGCACAPVLIGVTVINEQIYILMNYIEGNTLHDWLKTKPAPTNEEIKQRFSELKSALEKIHKLDLVHADIKPQNIWIPADSSIPAYFIDFGSATKVGERFTSITPGVTVSSFSPNKATLKYNIDILNKLETSLVAKYGGKHASYSRCHKRKKLNKSRRNRCRHTRHN